MGTVDGDHFEGSPQRESLLGQALQSYPLSDQQVVDDDAASNSVSSSSIVRDPIIPLHSDLTVPYSNVSGCLPLLDSPSMLDARNTMRRSVFGGLEKHKYGVTPPSQHYNGGGTYHHASRQPTFEPSASGSTDSSAVTTKSYGNTDFDCGMSDLTAPGSPTRQDHIRDLLSTDQVRSSHRKRPPMHETLHAQSLILGLAFLAIWSPQNCMAPNLTQMAADFGFSDKERDFYLGANVALATGVLSLPISAGIGILADVYNRKYLFCLTVAMGGFSAWLTGASQTYRMLFFARLLNGSFMSGSVPVAFSLLGDLFDTHERNAASSGLTAMMGLGIIAGQVYAGVVGSSKGWSHAFYVSAVATLISAALVLMLVREPIRGGKEEVLQAMLKHGTSYDRKLTWSGFCQTMRNNQSNMILIWQGFFSSIPWGIIFVFLNDYLSQERGFSVPDATYLVAVFGVGCAVGGILGGYWGQLVSSWNRSYLPIFMSVTTFLAIFPFIALLNGHFTNAHGIYAIGCSFLGGFVASLPSVCARPCLINVNPPEARGAALTAANLTIQLARGAGPSSITLMSAILRVDRQFSFNITLSLFWTISAVQLLYLSSTLPRDQDAMDAELAQYAATALAQHQHRLVDDVDDVSVSIEDRMMSWDAGAARQSMQFVGAAFKEIGDEIKTIRPNLLSIRCSDHESEDDDEDEVDQTVVSGQYDHDEVERRRQAWIRQQNRMAVERNDDVVVVKPSNEHTPLL